MAQGETIKVERLERVRRIVHRTVISYQPNLEILEKGRIKKKRNSSWWK